MHAYATDAKDREIIPVWLAFIAVVAALLLNSIVQKLNWQVPWWVDAPSVMGFYGILYKWFDNCGWFQKIGFISLSSIPDLRGTWVGTVHSSYNNGTITNGIIIYIHQTWSNINIRLETEISSSYSIMATVNTQESSEPSLKYEYLNEPSALSLQTMQVHRGTASMRLSPDGKMLKGDYFTGRGRQNIGIMEFKLVSRKYLTRENVLRQITTSP